MMHPPRTWTYNATLNIPYTCKVDVAINQSGRDIYFNQSGIYKRGIFSGIRVGHTYQSYDLRGRPWNLMFITDYLTGYTRRQVRFLIPWVCAVNKVERYDDTFPPNYELLVKDYWLDGPPKICLQRYEKFVKQSNIPSKPVYNRNCERYFNVTRRNTSIFWTLWSKEQHSLLI
uniref:Lipocalin n=1 Tax=Rhipicephalus zambeziensis TaxID=60191 RepID=A0A224YMP1_9ACAR